MSRSRQLVSAAQNAPSIVVIVGAYETFGTNTEKEFTSQSLPLLVVGSPRTAEPQTIYVTPSDVEPWLMFRALVDQWRVERGVMSSITQSALCPAYQSIIGMGPSVVPFILGQLRAEGDEPDQWFWALKAITDADPVSKEDRGDFPAMARAWLQWDENTRVW